MKKRPKFINNINNILLQWNLGSNINPGKRYSLIKRVHPKILLVYLDLVFTMSVISYLHSKYSKIVNVFQFSGIEGDWISRQLVQSTETKGSKGLNICFCCMVLYVKHCKTIYTLFIMWWSFKNFLKLIFTFLNLTEEKVCSIWSFTLRSNFVSISRQAENDLSYT